MTSVGLTRAGLKASNALAPRKVYGLAKSHVEWDRIAQDLDWNRRLRRALSRPDRSEDRHGLRGRNRGHFLPEELSPPAGLREDDPAPGRPCPSGNRRTPARVNVRAMLRPLLVACEAALLAATLRADAAPQERIRRYFEAGIPSARALRFPYPRRRTSSFPATRPTGPSANATRRTATSSRSSLVGPGEETRSSWARSCTTRSGTPNPSRRPRIFPSSGPTLQDAYGLPVALRVGAGARGSLLPLQVTPPPGRRARWRRSRDSFLRTARRCSSANSVPSTCRPNSGATRCSRSLQAYDRERGKFAVTAFIDFQCEKCRQREPQVRDFVAKRGGALEIRFLPLVKVHDWAFAAAESAAALAGVSPALYVKYEEAIFPQAGSMTEPAARELAADVADAAGAAQAFDAEISSGRARDRVVSRRFDLALRLGPERHARLLLPAAHS